MERVEIEFVKGTRKNELSQLQSYLFEKNRPVLLGISYRCLNYKISSCPARIHVLDGGSFLKGAHNHAPNPENVTVRKIIAVAKEKVKENRLTTTAQVLELVENAAVEENLQPFLLGSTDSLKRKIRYTRYKAHGNSNIGNTRGEIDVPVGLTKTVRETEFLLYDNRGQENRMLIFASADALDKLAFCNTWLADGTFKSCTKQFAQLYTIHGVYKNTYPVPLIFAYLPGKTYEIYLEFFGAVRRHVNGEPECIITDFEIAAINAGKQTFIATEMKGCLFHLTQSVFRRVQQYPELLQRYRNNDNDGLHVRNVIRTIGALTFIREPEVFHAFMELRATIPAGDTIREIFMHFQNNYMGYDWEDIRFPIKFWNVRDLFENAQPRTNNSKEGWHFRFNNLHTRAHHSMHTSIQMLRMEEKHYYIEFQKIMGGFVPGRKKKSISIDTRLRNIIQNQEAQVYNNDTEFLKAVQYYLHYFIQE